MSARELVGEMVAAILSYGIPFMDRLSSVEAVLDSMNTTGEPPLGVRQSGLPGKPGVCGNKAGDLPPRALGYYRESDV